MEWCDYDMHGVLCDGECCSECRSYWQYLHTSNYFSKVIKDDFQN